MEPLDGYLRGRVFVYVDDDIRGEISFKSYKDKIKISPGDEDSSFEVFEYFIENFEKHVCELTFLGGLDKMK